MITEVRLRHHETILSLHGREGCKRVFRYGRSSKNRSPIAPALVQNDHVSEFESAVRRMKPRLLQHVILQLCVRRGNPKIIAHEQSPSFEIKRKMAWTKTRVSKMEPDPWFAFTACVICGAFS